RTTCGRPGTTPTPRAPPRSGTRSWRTCSHDEERWRVGKGDGPRRVRTSRRLPSGDRRGSQMGRQKADMTSRRPLIETAQGTRREAFGPREGGLPAAIAAGWGSSFLFIEIGLEHFGPGVVAFGRVAVGAVTLSLLRGSHRPIERDDLPRVALLGAVWMAAPLLLFPIGQQWSAPSLAGLLNGAVPIFAAVTAATLLRRVPASRQLIGIAVGFLGVVGVLWPATRDAD